MVRRMSGALGAAFLAISLTTGSALAGLTAGARRKPA
jgi:hypothetical protein